MLKNLTRYAIHVSIGVSSLVSTTAFSARSDMNFASSRESIIKMADFIFQGSVTKVEYRKSTVTGPREIALPHTFVTYHIERIFKGRAQGDTITLRFLGGPSDNGSILLPAEFPLFDVGDADVLFVKDNGLSACPLVGCIVNRFRSIKGKVFDSTGREVLLTPENKIAFGRTHDLQDIAIDKIGSTEIKKETVQDPLDLAKDLLPPAGRQFEPAGFAQFIEDSVSNFYSKSQLERMADVTTLDPDRTFSMNAPIAQPPPRSPNIVRRNPTDRTIDDELEREAVERNGGNPVLPN